MKIFISWSGDRSRMVGELINHWISKNIQAATPWISGEDIGSGAMWFQEIKRELDETSLGIICITRENLYKPWILFEAGALAKGTRDNRVCTFLIDLPLAEVHLPLSQFNATVIEKESFRKLARTINGFTAKPLSEPIIDEIVNESWPGLEEKINRILSSTETVPAPAKRTTEQLLLEILDQVNSQSKNLADLSALSNHVRKQELSTQALETFTKFRDARRSPEATAFLAYYKNLVDQDLATPATKKTIDDIFGEIFKKKDE